MTICNWNQDEDGVWWADCLNSNGHPNAYIFEDGNVEENGFKYCPFCGLSITAVPYSEYEENVEENGT